jgi:hypothetical protein
LRLLLVRHGETEGNVSRRLQGADDPLTERGRRQAEEIAAHLSGRDDVVALYASPYRRAFDTARAIGERFGVEPEPRPALAELDVGEAAGYRFEAWVEEFPEEAERFRTEGVDYSWPGGESGRDLSARAGGEIDGILGLTAARTGRWSSSPTGARSPGSSRTSSASQTGSGPYSYSQARQLLHHGGRDTGRRRGAREVPLHQRGGHLSPDPDEEAATGRDPVD